MIHCFHRYTLDGRTSLSHNVPVLRPPSIFGRARRAATDILPRVSTLRGSRAQDSF
jgi:hypothetical protein